MFDQFINIHELTKYEGLNNITYKNTPSDKISLQDMVIVYNDGKNNKIYDLNFLSNNPIIYDKYYDNIIINRESGLQEINVTITHCPISLSTIVYFGKYRLTGDVYQNNIVIQNINDNDEYILQLSGDVFSKKNKVKIDKKIFRVGTKIMTLRHAISHYPDSIFNDEVVKDGNIYDETYTKIFDEIFSKTNIHLNIDPKTIIYTIEYYSSDEMITKKYSAIVHKNTHVKFDKAYDQYFGKTGSKLLEKGAFITPCYLGTWILFHPNTKIINI